ncbi:hypothetical protein ACI2L1_32945 [Streptomyces sp. NPDC019531]|uniref:hypothetical protein n=1 Tax=Streptomyces sp. NPDC019531 TaxID=3365062 RepID=UPI00384D39CF
MPPARTRPALAGVGAAVGGLVLVPLWTAPADSTQTRAEDSPDAVGTTMVFRVETTAEGGSWPCGWPLRISGRPAVAPPPRRTTAPR